MQDIRLGFEEVDLTVAEYQKLKQTLKGVTLFPTRDRIENLRMIKPDDEISNIRQAAKITDECFYYIIYSSRPALASSQEQVL